MVTCKNTQPIASSLFRTRNALRNLITTVVDSSATVGMTAIMVLILISSQTFGQKKNRAELTGEDIIRKGLVRAQGTISPGWTIANGTTNLYLQGDLEYYLENRVSLKGDISYFIGSVGSKEMKQNHSLFFGAQYHFPYKRFDPYVGLHPGASLIQMRNMEMPNAELAETITESQMKIAPAVSVSTGFNYYVWRYIHFMANVKYVHATHTTEWGATTALDEFRISFGLGWNVNLRKKK